MNFSPTLLLALAIGCTAPRSEPAPLRTESFEYEGRGGARASVFRVVTADGHEALHGETEISGLRLIEDATLDASGHLVRAEVRLARCDGATEDHMVIDRALGTVRADAPGGPVDYPIPTDAPWAIAPLDRGAATPVMAWIAARAASQGDSVRMIRTDARSSYRAPASQVSIATELGSTVIVGDSVSGVDRVFVQRVEMIHRPFDLVRVERANPIVACALAPMGPAVESRE